MSSEDELELNGSDIEGLGAGTPQHRSPAPSISSAGTKASVVGARAGVGKKAGNRKVVAESEDEDEFVEEAPVAPADLRSPSGSPVRISQRPVASQRDDEDNDDGFGDLYTYWETLPDTLRRLDVPHSVPLSSASLRPSKEHLSRMAAHSKGFSLLQDGDKRRLMLPYNGIPYVFVEPASHLPGRHTVDVLHFFNQVCNAGRNWKNYCVPTTHVSLDFDKDEPEKVVKGFIFEGLACDGSSARPAQSGEYTNIRRILQKRGEHQAQNLRVPVDPVDVKVLWVGATGQVGGVEKRMMFCCTVVTPVTAFNLWEYVHNVFCAQPEKTAKNYAEEFANYKLRSAALARMMQTEAFTNLGMDHDEHRDIERKFRYSPGGEGGVITLLNMFMVVFKIFHLFRTAHPGAREIRIMDCPAFKFTSDDRTNGWEAYMHEYINQAAAHLSVLKAAIDQFWATKKERNQLAPFEQQFMGGWPLRVCDDYVVRKFGFPPFPLMAQFQYRSDICATPEVFLANLGGSDALPELVQLLYSAFMNKASPVGEYPYIEHFLSGAQLYDPIAWTRKYLGGDADLTRGLILDGRWKYMNHALQQDIRERRAGGTGVQEVAAIWHEYVEGLHSTLLSMLANGAFQSDTLRHSGELLRLANWDEACTTDEDSVRATLARLSEQTPHTRRHDGFAVALKAFMRMWEELNVYLHMNSANTTYLMELFVSTLMLKFGDNQTWDKFCIMILVVGGYGHFMVNTPAGPGPDNRKQNSTGNDFVKARMAQLWRCLYHLLGVVDKRKHYEIPADVARWTATALENMITATIVLGTLVTAPSATMRDRPLVAPEMRGPVQGALITSLARGEAADQTLTASTCQTAANSGVYTAATKEEICKIPLCAGTSNELHDTAEKREKGKTLMVVSKLCLPGAPVFRQPKRDSDGEIKLVKGSADNQRAEAIPIPQRPAYFLALPHVVCGVNALKNRLQGVGFDIPKSISGLMEWLYLIVKNFEGLMDTTVVESFHRLAQGHMSRHVALCSWVETIRLMAQGRSEAETSRDLVLSLQFNPFPLPSVALALDSFLPRCIHMPSQVLSVGIIEDLRVPVIDRVLLAHFFNTPDAPPREDGQHYTVFQAIKAFVGACIRDQCFLPENEEDLFDSGSNVSCYITNPMVSGASEDGFLLVRSWKRVPDDSEAILKSVGNQFRNARGRDSYQAGMNKEACIAVNAFRDLRDKYDACATLFCGEGVYKGRAHLQKLGLLAHLPGMKDRVTTERVPFIRTVNIRGSGGPDRAAVGVNIWAILVQASILREPQMDAYVNNKVAGSILKFALDMAPMACTPSNRLCRAGFNPSSGKNEEVVLEPDRNIHHFLRGVSDDFPSTGRLTILPVQPRTDACPEDYLHMPWADAVADFYSCDIDEIPASAVTVHLLVVFCLVWQGPDLSSRQCAYSIMPDWFYTSHVPGTQDNGLLLVQSRLQRVQFTSFNYDEAAKANVKTQELDWELDEWEARLRDQGHVLTPMLWRRGVAVRLVQGGRTVVGVLITPGGVPCQFHHPTSTYEAMFAPAVYRDEDEEEAPASSVRVHFAHALKNLLPPGEPLLLDHGALAQEEFRKPGKYLKVRLNLPNTLKPEEGRLYVTCHYHSKAFGRPEAETLPSVTMAVDPWDLTLPSEFQGDAGDILCFLQPVAI